jgi:SAM-dependent methyltransferase
MSEAGFDAFAESYDADLQRALSASGEGKEFFARGRIEWMLARLAKRNDRPQSVLDFGCGTGSAAPLLLEAGLVRQVGVDVSEKSIEAARKTHPQLADRFHAVSSFRPGGEFDLAYTNGVFHHIPPAERLNSALYVWEALRPGGYFAFWENNPWNPGTRYVMSNCAFDHDAITLTPAESRKLLRLAGFEIVATDFLFIFPRALRWLRFLEPPLSALPLGGQYMVLCRKQA